MTSFHSMLSRAKRRPVFTLVLAVAALFALNILRYAVWPPVGNLAKANPATTAFIEHRAATAKTKGRTIKIYRVWKPLTAISPHLRKAVVVAEDSTFRDHDGFDFEGMRDAMKRNILRRRFAAGGSTITQQLAKNLYFNPEKSLVRKMQEAVVAFRLERNLSKDRILELYLNCVEWGDGIFGAEAAARHYYNTNAATLSPTQAARLAAMLPAPLKRKPDSPVVRRHAATILARMRIE